MLGLAAAFFLGLDNTLVRRLPANQRVALWRHVATTAVSCGSATAAALATARALGAAEAWVALGGLCTGAFVWNLFRLLHAGTGMALHLTDVESQSWRPTPWLPACVLSLIGAVLAQPLHVALRAEELGPLVAAERARLAAEHERIVLGALSSEESELQQDSDALHHKQQLTAARSTVLAATEDTVTTRDEREQLRAFTAATQSRLALLDLRLQYVRAEHARLLRDDVEPYVSNLSNSPFTLVCIHAVWAQSVPAFFFTLLFVSVLVLPLFLRSHHPQGIRDYERLRRAGERATVITAYQSTASACRAVFDEQLAQLATVCPSSTKRSREAPQYLDAPFNREPCPASYHGAVTVAPAALLARIAGGKPS